MASLADMVLRLRQEGWPLVPPDLESPRLLIALGFTNETARKIWKIWSRNLDDPQPPLYEIARKYLVDVASKKSDVCDDSVDWPTAMDDWGLTTELQDAILNPRFKDIRNTSTLLFCVNSTMHTRLQAIMMHKCTNKLK